MVAHLGDFTDRVLNAGSILEAKNILYGSSFIQDNANEYFKRIISHFIKRKDLLIKKVENIDPNTGQIKYELLFDLDKDYKDVFNIIFLGMYCTKKIEEEINNIDNILPTVGKTVRGELFKIVNISSTDDELRTKIQQSNLLTQVQKSLILSKNDVEIKNYIIDYAKSLIVYETELLMQRNQLQDLLNNIKLISANVYSSSNVSRIENDLEKLKDAMIKIHFLRCKNEHNEIVSNYEKKIITIKFKDVSFDIPIDYLDGFTKGKIIVKDEDKDIYAAAMNTSKSIIEELGYNIYEIESFFYNVDPNDINYLLSALDNDINKFYKLPMSKILSAKTIKNLVDLGMNINYALQIRQLPGANFNEKKIMELYNYGIDIRRFTLEDFIHPKEIIRMYDAGIDIYRLLNVDYNSEQAYSRFNYTQNIEEFITRFINGENIYQSVINNKSMQCDFTFSYEEINKERISNYKSSNPEEFEKARIRLGIAEDDIYKYDFSIYEYIESSLVIKEELKESFEEIGKKLVLQLHHQNTDLLRKLLNAGYSIEKIMEITKNITLSEIYKAHEAGIDLNRFPFHIFNTKIRNLYNPKYTTTGSYSFRASEIISIMNEYDIYNLPYDKMCSIDDMAGINPRKFCIKNINKLLELTNNDYQKIKMLPEIFFYAEEDKLDEMYLKYNENIARTLFGTDNPKIVSILLYMNDTLKQIDKLDYEHIDLETDTQFGVLDYIVNINGLSQLNQAVNQSNYHNFISNFITLQSNNFSNEHLNKDKAELLRHLRNSSAHFRYKLLKNPDGTIDDKKILLYDEDDSANNTMEIVISIDDLMDIIKRVEKYILLKNNQLEPNGRIIT